MPMPTPTPTPTAAVLLLLFPCCFLLPASCAFPLCTDARAPLPLNGTLAFCAYGARSTSCCDAALRKQFDAVNVSDAACAVADGALRKQFDAVNVSGAACAAAEDALRKQFDAVNVSDAACAAVLKSNQLAKCNPYSAELFDAWLKVWTVPFLCNSTSSATSAESKESTQDYCKLVRETYKDVAIPNPTFQPPLQRGGELPTSPSKLTDALQSENELCTSFGGSPNDQSVCFSGDTVLFNTTQASPSPKGICLERIHNGYDSYLNMVPHPDGSNRVFLGTQAGKIWLATVPEQGSAGTLQFGDAGPLIDLTDQEHFDRAFECMGMAFPPNFAAPGIYKLIQLLVSTRASVYVSSSMGRPLHVGASCRKSDIIQVVVSYVLLSLLMLLNSRHTHLGKGLLGVFSSSPVAKDAPQLLDATKINGPYVLDLWDELGLPTHLHVEGHSPTKCGVTQIFVKIYGFSISLQPDLNQLSVKSLIDFSLEKAGVRSTDFYAICCGKILHPEKPLAYYAIQKDSTVKLEHRLRGGIRNHTIKCKTWDDVVSEERRFHIVNLSPTLVDQTQNFQSAKFLSQHLQYHARGVLITMCRNHKRGISFNGKFTSSEILFHDGNAVFACGVKRESATRNLFLADYLKISSILESAFRDNANTFPIHVKHLLGFLKSPPANIQLDSDLAIAFITNHPAVIPFTKRMNICNLLDSLLKRIPQKYAKILKTLYRHQVDWTVTVKNIPEMKKVYFYNAKYDRNGRATYVTYGTHLVGFVRFSRNFFKHAPSNLNLEEIEASFSVAMHNHNVLPQILQTLAVEIDSLPSDFIEDLLKVFGNNLIGLKDT